MIGRYRKQLTRAARGLAAAFAVIAFAGHTLPVSAQVARVERDIGYVSNGGTDQTADIHVPVGRDFATVIFVHGGSLQESGERRSSPVYAHVCEPFIAAGVGCVTIDYRLAPTHHWPAMAEDVAAAVRWVRDNIAARGGDPSRLFVFGHSSGCHLAAIVGTNARYLEGVGLTPSDLAGVIPMGCILAPAEAILRRAQTRGIGLDSLRVLWSAQHDDVFPTFADRLDADPSRFVGRHAPPALIVVAEQERFLPPILEQAARFVGLMYEAERPADIVIVPGTHMRSIADIVKPGDPTFAAILRFIQHPDSAGVGSRPSTIH